jgi:hypothetical protein
LNKNKDVDKLNVGTTKFVVFVINFRGVVMFVAEKNRERRRNEIKRRLLV